MENENNEPAGRATSSTAARFFARLRGLRWPYKAALGILLLVALAALYALWDSQRGLEQPVAYRFDQKVAGGAQELIVVVHGFARGSRPMEGLIRALRESRPGSDIGHFEYASQTFSNASPFVIAAQMEETIRGLHAERGYQRIRLVGYSMGAQLVRKAYVYGAGSVEDWPYADPSRPTLRQPQEWVRHVDRFVLLAGMNRGWSQEEPPKTLPLLKSIVNSVGFFIGKLSGTGHLILDLRRGEPFVANLRLQWLDVMKRANNPDSGLVRPTVVQLLGDQDNIVGPDDNRDVTVAKDFIWVGVSNTNHSNVVDVEQPDAGLDRKRKILQALGSDADIEALKRAMPAPQTDEDPDVTTVVFVLHGIRDMGAWTSNFEEPLQKRFREQHPGSNEKLYVHRAGYGYFAMGPFLLGSDRQRNVRWFMDQVTELKSRFPNLRELDFIGHSNGTYVLASALDKYNTLRVNKVVFAGSVVPRSFNWTRLAGRVTSVRNYVGVDDLVVGIFPHLFELPGFRAWNPDLGSAGFNGFEDGRFKNLETAYLKGGHGAALHPDNIQGIVDFILDEKKVEPASLLVRERSQGLSFTSQLCWLIWLGLIGVVAGIGWLVVRFIRHLHARGQWRMSRTAASWLATLLYATTILMLINTI